MCTIRSLIVLLALLVPGFARANEFCEPAGTDCRAVLLRYINSETMRIDVGMEEMVDSMLADALIAKHRAGVPVRLLVEPRRNSSEPRNAPILARLKAAGIPMRYKPAGGILHWKMMIFDGQDTVEFSAAQFSPHYLVPVQPFVNFTQDPIVFLTNTAVVQSFQRKFDDAWVDTANFANYANAATPARAYPLYAISSSMNFVPGENFLTRVKPLYDAETVGIDVIIYKVTESGHADAMIRAVNRTVPVRVIVEPLRYRAKDNVWQAYHIDRMHAAGVQIRNRKHAGFTHQKTALLVGQRRTIFGSSNWTAASNSSQYEHNYLTTDSQFYTWFRNVFLRKWQSTTETTPFVPLPPDAPVYLTPANTAGGQPTTVVLSWKPGPWAHKADVYLGTSSTPAFKSTVSISPNTTKKLTVSVQPGMVYFWRVVSKTMAGKTASGPVWSFGT